MEKMEQHVQQGDAERRIEVMNAEEVNQVSGGHGPNRFLGASAATPHARTPSLPSGKTVYLS